MLNELYKTFIGVAETKSFSKASEKLYISTTAIMKQMNLLEKEIGLPLLIRTHRGVQLTQAGKSLYDDAKFIAAYSEQAIARAYKAELKEQYTINIGSSILFPAKQLLSVWNRVKSLYPQFKLRIVPLADDSEELFSELGKRFDIVVGANGGDKTDGLSFLKMSEYHFAIAAPADHPLAEKKAVTYNDLHGYHLMMMKPGNSLANDKIREEIETGHPEIVLEEAPYHYDVDTFNACEESGMLLLTLDGWQDIHPSLVTIPLKVDYTIPYGIIYSETPSEATRLFINVAKQIL